MPGRKTTIIERRGWVKAYKRKVESYKKNGLDIPNTSKIAKDLGVHTQFLRKCLDESGIKYVVHSRGFVKGWKKDTPIEIDI